MLQNSTTPEAEKVAEALSGKTSKIDKTKEEEKEKQRILRTLDRLTRTGKVQINYSNSDSLIDLRRKNLQATHIGRAKTAVKVMKRAIVFVAKMAEKVTARFPNRFLDLEGYADHLYSQIDTYEDMLHDVFEFYADSFTEVNPMFTLIMAIGSNMVMYSMTRSMQRKKEYMQKILHERRQERRDRLAERGYHKRRKTGDASEMSGPETDNETVASAKPSIPDDKTEKSFFTMKTQEEVKAVLPEPRAQQESSLRAAVSDPKTDEPSKTIEVAVPEKKKKDSMMVIDLESVKK